MSCTTPACFSTFLIFYGPYSNLKFLIFMNLIINFFGNTIIMIMIEIQYSGSLIITGEPMHTASKQWYPVMYINYCLKRRRFIVSSYVQLVIQHHKSTTV